MRKALATGTLLWLLKEMPQPLQVRFREELERLDRERSSRRQPGDTKLVSLANHLRWVSEHQAELGDMKLQLFDVLTRYFPISLQQAVRNEVPSQVDCQFFWARELALLEKESTKKSIPA